MTTDAIKLNADIRKEFTRGSLNAVRREGKLPAVVYGPSVKNLSISVDEKEFKKAISTEHGENALIKVAVKGKKPVTTIIKEIQVHPLSMKLLHVDFCQINLKEEVEVEVPLEVEGSSPGVKEAGGVLEHIVRKVSVRCLPTEIPDVLTVDISGMEVGESLHISDVKKVKEVEILDDPESVVVHVGMPTELEEPEELEEELAAEEEPEVIGKEKPEGEEEAEEAPEQPEEAEEE